MELDQSIKKWLLRTWLALILFGLFLAIQTIISVRQGRNIVVAQSTMHNIVAALETYRIDFKAYPPESAGKDGSEIFARLLTKQIKNGEMMCGPYFQARDNADFLSFLGGRYTYKLIDSSSGVRPLVIDPGADRKLGGTIDPKKGFVPDGSGDAADNIYSNHLPDEGQSSVETPASTRDK